MNSRLLSLHSIIEFSTESFLLGVALIVPLMLLITLIMINGTNKNRHAQTTIRGALHELYQLCLEVKEACQAETMTDQQATQLFDILFAESRFIA